MDFFSKIPLILEQAHMWYCLKETVLEKYSNVAESYTCFQIFAFSSKKQVFFFITSKEWSSTSDFLCLNCFTDQDSTSTDDVSERYIFNLSRDNHEIPSHWAAICGKWSQHVHSPTRWHQWQHYWSGAGKIDILLHHTHYETLMETDENSEEEWASKLWQKGICCVHTLFHKL